MFSLCFNLQNVEFYCSEDPNVCIFANTNYGEKCAHKLYQKQVHNFIVITIGKCVMSVHFKKRKESYTFIFLHKLKLYSYCPW